MDAASILDVYTRDANALEAVWRELVDGEIPPERWDNVRPGERVTGNFSKGILNVWWDGDDGVPRHSVYRREQADGGVAWKTVGEDVGMVCND